MNIDPIYVSSTLSTISQIVSTILSIYLAIFIFNLQYLWKDFIRKRNTKKIRVKIIFWINIILSLLLIPLIFIFLVPSLELKIGYIILFLPLIFIIINLIIFWRKKDFYFLEKGTIILSFIYSLLSFILGFYLILSSISLIPFSIYIEDKNFFTLISYTRIFLISTLISSIYLFSFMFIHKFIVTKENGLEAEAKKGEIKLRKS
jgi:hypothetical protein